MVILFLNPLPLIPLIRMMAKTEILYEFDCLLKLWASLKLKKDVTEFEFNSFLSVDVHSYLESGEGVSSLTMFWFRSMFITKPQKILRVKSSSILIWKILTNLCYIKTDFVSRIFCKKNKGHILDFSGRYKLIFTK